MEKTWKRMDFHQTFYVINTFEDRINDKDLQIKKAVEEIMKELKK